VVFSDTNSNQTIDMNETTARTNHRGRFWPDTSDGGTATPYLALDGGIAQNVLLESPVNTTTCQAQFHTEVALSGGGIELS
jgi:hypothetical protein